MEFEKLYSNQFKDIEKYGKNFTRSPKILIPCHSAIAKIVEENTNFHTALEYEFKSDFGNKKIDIAILDNNNNLVGAIMFKAIRSNYNKNHNNYKETMLGESLIITSKNIPVYQLTILPTNPIKGDSIEKIDIKKDKEYNALIDKSPLGSLLKIGRYYFDIDYTTNTAKYSNRKIKGSLTTVTDGIKEFCEEVKMSYANRQN